MAEFSAITGLGLDLPGKSGLRHTREAPRLCRGGSSSLTFQAIVHRSKSRLVSHHAHEGAVTMDEFESLTLQLRSGWTRNFEPVLVGTETGLRPQPSWGRVSDPSAAS